MRDEEGEMGRFRGKLPCREKVRVTAQRISLHSYTSLILITDISDFLDVPVKNHLLHLRPFHFLGTDALVAEKHPADSQNQE